MTTVNPTTLDASAAPVSESLRARAMRASAWTFGGHFASRGLRLVSNLILTRLLMPEAFGLMLIVTLFTQGLQMFSDVGIGPSIIQNRRGDEPDYLNTAWTIQVIRGCVLWLVACAIAWPVSTFYADKPELLYLLPVAGLSALIAGFNSTSLFTLNKRLQLGKATMLEIGARAASMIATIAAAIITRSVWALVIGTLVSALVKMIFSHVLLRDHRNRLRWDWTAVRELIAFGRWIFIGTVLTFLATGGDRLVLGKIIPAGVMGVYAIAYVYYEAPRKLVMQLSRTVLYPMMSERATLPRDEFRRSVEQHRPRLLLPAIAGVALVACFADVIIKTLYEPAYHGAGWMLSLMIAGLWFRVLNTTVSPALMVFHKLHYNPIGSVCRIAMIAVGLPLGFHFAGLFGGVAVIAASDAPNYLVDLYGLRRNGLSLLRQDLWATALLLGAMAVLLAGRFLLGLGSPIDDGLATVTAAGTLLGG